MRNPGSVRPLGVHVPAAAGLATGGLRYAEQVGAEAVQVFVSSPRSWALSAGNPAEDAAFRDQTAATGMPVFVHSPYLTNIASPDPLTWQRSVRSLAHSFTRAASLGARGVVVHTGSTVGSDRGAALGRVAEALLPLLDGLGERAPDLLLELTAGQGGLLCARLADLEPYFAALGWHPRAGVCLDTCRLFAAGYDLAAPGTATALLAEFSRLTRRAGTAGNRLKLIHANDSKDPCGSRRDRHENIGAGLIGLAAFGELLGHPATAGAAFIVETPGPKAAHAADVAALKRLRCQPGPRRG